MFSQQATRGHGARSHQWFSIKSHYLARQDTQSLLCHCQTNQDIS